MRQRKPLTTDDLLERARKDYLAALLGPSSEEASKVLQKVLPELGTTRLYLNIVSPVLSDLGDLWCSKKISITAEHLATQIILGHLQSLRDNLSPRVRLNRSALVASVEGEPHMAGARVLADLLHFDGWKVYFAGPDNPTSDLVSYARESQPDLIALSVTLESNLKAAEQAARKLSRLRFSPWVMVGGSVFEHLPVEADDWEVELITSDARLALERARQLVGLERSEVKLEGYLAALGRRIQQVRLARGFSQQQLAGKAGLDRTSIIALEHGRQNPTISALLKVSNALNLPIESLLSERTPTSPEKGKQHPVRR